MGEPLPFDRGDAREQLFYGQFLPKVWKKSARGRQSQKIELMDTSN